MKKDAPSRGEIHETAARINGTVVAFDDTSDCLAEECRVVVQIPWKLLK